MPVVWQGSRTCIPLESMPNITRTWDDQNGTKHYITEVVAEEVYFADSRRDGDGASSSFENTFGATMPGGMGDASDFEVSASDDLPF